MRKYLSVIPSINEDETIIIDDKIIVWPDCTKKVIQIKDFYGPLDNNYKDDSELIKLSEILSDLVRQYNRVQICNAPIVEDLDCPFALTNIKSFGNLQGLYFPADEILLEQYYDDSNSF